MSKYNIDCKKCKHYQTDICSDCTIETSDGCSCHLNPPCPFCIGLLFERRKEMIEELNKYKNTWRKFELYMRKFNHKTKYVEFEFEGDELDIYTENDRGSYTLQDQFLVGCLMEFLEENKIYVEIVTGDGRSNVFDNRDEDSYGTKEYVFEKAFEILEERNE